MVAIPAPLPTAMLKSLPEPSRAFQFQDDNDVAMGRSSHFSLDQALGAWFIRPDMKDSKAG